MSVLNAYRERFCCIEQKSRFLVNRLFQVTYWCW